MDSLNPLSDNFILKRLLSLIGQIIDSLNPLSDNFILKTLLAWLNSFFTSLGSFFQPLWNFISTLLDTLNPFSNNFFLKTLFTWIGNFFTALNTLLDPLWGFITNLLSWFNPFSENFFAYKFIDLLKNALSFLFIPSQERIDALLNIPKEKLSFIDSIKSAINSMKNIINNVGNAPKLVLSLNATNYTQAGDYTIVDFSWYAPYKNYGDLVLTGFIYIFFLWRLFITIPAILNGQSGSIFGDYMESDRVYYTQSKHGFGKHF